MGRPSNVVIGLKLGGSLLFLGAFIVGGVSLLEGRLLAVAFSGMVGVVGLFWFVAGRLMQ